MLRLVAALIAAFAFLATPASGSAANRYVGYVACSTSKSAPAATTCPKSSNKAAFFKSRDASVTYKICVKFPSGTKLCASNQSAPKGVKRVNTISSSQKGSHKVTWFVNGVQVAAWTFQVT